MILSGPIRPAQLKTFHGIVDFYYDKHGRVIARQWPRKSTTPNPGLMATAARMQLAHTLRAQAHPGWKPSWNFPNMPQGRTPNDLSIQNVLWQLAATTSPCLCTITDLGHDWSEWEEKHMVWFRTDPPWSTINDKIEMHVWTYPANVILAPTLSYSNQLFRRGDETLRRPILSWQPPRLKTDGDGPFYTDWWLIETQDWPNENYRFALRPFWKDSSINPPTPGPSPCYGRAERPLPCGGLWTVGPAVTGDLPY